MGGGSSTFRVVRIALLVVFLVLAATLHGRGSTYNTLHIVYIVLVIGLLVGSLALGRGRRGLQRGNRQGGGNDPVGRGGFGGAPPAPPPHAEPMQQTDPESGN